MEHKCLQCWRAYIFFLVGLILKQMFVTSRPPQDPVYFSYTSFRIVSDRKWMLLTVGVNISLKVEQQNNEQLVHLRPSEVASSKMADTVGWNLADIETGLRHTPRHVSEHLQWLTEEGQQLYTKRQASVDVFSREETALSLCSLCMARRLSDHLVLVDLGAGLSTKTIRMMKCLLNGSPQRRICYIPVDVSEVIMSWRDYLDESYPEISERVVHIYPVLLDMLDAVQSIDQILEKSVYSDWELVFSLFGPTSTILHNAYFVQMVRGVGKVLKPRGDGGFIFTYLPAHNRLKERINMEYYDKLDMSAIMKCVLLGLNQVSNTDVDPDQFEYEKEYINHKKTEGIDGEWTGFAIYARAKENLTISSEKLGLTLTLEAGERIRLSDDVVKAHYYSDKYIASLASTSGLDIQGVYPEPSQLISAVLIGPTAAANTLRCEDYTLCMQTPSPRHS